MVRRQLDAELVARGLVPTLDAARGAVGNRRVLVDGAPALNPSMLILPHSQIRLRERRRYVSRGGDKLAAALEQLRVPVAGRRCLDAGTGSGGFTDCLLRGGASSVTAVDVGYGQFDWELRRDPRVRLLERTNIRLLPPEELGGPFDLVVADLSFISLGAVAGVLAAASAESADLVLLVKPQFEAPASDVGRGGVVRDPAVWERAVASVGETLAALGLGIAGVTPARPRGARGNQEFFVWSRRDAPPPDPDALRAAVVPPGAP